MRYGTTAASTSSSTSGWSAGAVQLLVYDGTNWVREYWSNSTYSNASLGQGYATCTTAAATAAKVASLSSYALSTGGIVSIKFSYDVPANATLNINSKGAKAIWYNGAAITAGIIKAGDIATFMYDGTQYQLISIDIVYKASNGIKLDGDTFKHTNSVTAKTSGSQATAAPGYGGTFTVMEPLYDAQGHITGTSSATITMPSAQTIPTTLKNPQSLVIGNVTYDGSTKKTVTAADLGITGAMLFKGTSSTEITDGGTQDPTIGGTAVATSNLQAGNVVLYGNQEFVWNGSAWELLGDEGSYALKGHTHNYAGSSSAGGAATSANKVNSSLSIQLNGGTATVFDGSTGKSINITPAAIGAAAASHGTHVTYSTTAPVVDGTASAGSASTVARSDHKHPTDTTRAAASDLSAHTGNTTVHITNDERTNWNTAYTHSQATHAPTDAEKNQNAFSNVVVGTTTIAADKATDTLTFVAGSNITLTPDATNDKITIEAKDTVYTHPSHTAANSGFYKFAVNSLGHVTSVAAVEKSDITALGIPAQDTTYGAEKGITLSSGKFGHTNSVTAKTTYNQSTSAPGYGGTFKITEPIYDAYGHITGSQVATITMPSAQTIPTSFTITANGSGDNVVLLTKSNGSNAVTYNVEHEKMFNAPSGLTTTKYTSGNTTTSITTSGTIKIPQLTVDEYGHVTSASDENVTITMPTALKSPKTLTVGSKSYDGSADITIAASDLGLSNALHFIGIKDSIPTSGTYANGDVILVGKKEYVYSNSAWVELGDESSFALKTITITGNNGLTGSGNLSGNVTLSHADTSSQDSITASGRTYITGVTLDDYGHVTGLTTGTETVTNTHYTTKLFATGSSGTAHAATTNGNTYLRLFDSSTARQSIKIVGSGATTVTSDANGVITISSTDNNTVYTHPTSSGNKHIPSGGSSGQILRWSADGTAVWGNDNNTTYSAGTGLTLDGTTFKHTNSITAGTVGTAQSPGHGGTFAIPSITYDAQGHITGATTVNITLPADNNTDTKVKQSETTTSNYRPLLVGSTNTTTVADLAADTTAQAYVSTKFYAKPSTGDLYATTFNGALNGNAKTATTATNVAWSGVTSKPEYYDGKAITSITRNGTTFTATYLDGTTTTFTQQDNNTTYSEMTGATSRAKGKSGLVPAPAAGKHTAFLRGDGTWATPTNTTYSAMTGATSSAAGKSGLVPAPAAGDNTKFLRGDGTWVVPTNTNTTYTIATGDSNGQIKVTPSSGTAYNVSVKGLGSAAYTASTAYDAAGSANTALTNAKAYTDTKVAALVDSAPETLDTLNELAAALGDDPNFATTIATSIGTKANSSVTITAGNGLTGGGNLTANRTLNVGAGAGISVTADAVALATSGVTAGDYGPSANVTGSSGATISIPYITVDTYGRVTSASSKTYTTMTVDNAMSASSTNPVQNKVIKAYVDSKAVDTSSFLPRSAGIDYPLTGPLGLTQGQNYGSTLPASGFNGQLFFLEDTGAILPTGGTAGQLLVKNSTAENDASWQTLTVSNTVTGDTSNGPTINTTVNGVTGAAVTIPAASASASGVVTTGAQTFAGNKTFSGTVTNTSKVVISYVQDVAVATANTGSLIIGNPNGQHIAFDDNEIMAKNGSGATAGTLYLNNEGGAVQVGSGGLYGAVWNDYAEFRNQVEEIEPGYCVASADNGKVYKTTEKFQACDGIVSDTAGFFIGKTEECQTPLAVAGRVLAYFHGKRSDYHSGDTVCAGPEGKVMKMTREEIREWPDRIIGIVSEIPEYETWGSGNVAVNGRIWIKVR